MKRRYRLHEAQREPILPRTPLLHEVVVKPRLKASSALGLLSLIGYENIVRSQVSFDVDEEPRIRLSGIMPSHERPNITPHRVPD